MSVRAGELVSRQCLVSAQCLTFADAAEIVRRPCPASPVSLTGSVLGEPRGPEIQSSNLQLSPQHFNTQHLRTQDC